MLRLINGDCREVLRRLAEDDVRVSACVTDPPYGLDFKGNSWDAEVPDAETWRLVMDVMVPGAFLACFSSTRTYHRVATAIEDAGFDVRDQLAWAYGSGYPKGRVIPEGDWAGYSTSLKPAWEPVCIARRPLDEATVEKNLATHGAGAMNIEAGRVPGEKPVMAKLGKPASKDWLFAAASATTTGETTDEGRWPANLAHDGSSEVAALFNRFGGEDSPVRFFYCAKASSAERGEARHHTMKPLALMRWLVRLMTPVGGTVLDPFMGTGTTVVAAGREELSAIGIEIDPEYFAWAEERVGSLSRPGGEAR